MVIIRKINKAEVILIHIFFAAITITNWVAIIKNKSTVKIAILFPDGSGGTSIDGSISAIQAYLLVEVVTNTINPKK
jgi:hypothetical protein